jgi:hypothetical protein
MQAAAVVAAHASTDSDRAYPGTITPLPPTRGYSLPLVLL